MAGGGTQQSMRKYLGAIKDSTTVNLAKVNSEYKDLDIAIVKATNHVEHPAKEKHVQAIFAATSAARPRADVAYCIHALARRLAKTHNWVVALKTLIVIHRALREVDLTFREELINYGRNRSHMLNLSHFKDDSSPEAWEYSAWVRTYALYLEEKLECFRVVNYDVEIEPSKTRDLDTVELLEHLPALQELLFRLLGCQPQGAAAYNMIIQSAVSMVVDESIKLYTAINNGILNLVDKFFDMQHHHAIKAIDIYKRAGKQAEKLSELYEMCKSIGFRRGEGFIKVDQPLASFVTVMEEYAKDAPMAPTMRKDELPKVPNHRIEAPKTVLPIEYKESPKVQEEPNPPPPPPPEPVKVAPPPPTPVPEEPADLLGLKSETNPHAAELDNQNAMALAIVPVDSSSATTSTDSHVAGAGWELALVTAPSSNESAATTSTMAGGFDKLTLDSLYDDATRRANQSTSYNPWEMPTMGNHNMMQPVTHDPFYVSHGIAAPPNVQMAMMAQQQQAFMMQQQMQQPAVGYQQPWASTNPFGDPNDGTGFQQSSNTHGGLI